MGWDKQDLFTIKQSKTSIMDRGGSGEVTIILEELLPKNGCWVNDSQ